MKKENDEMLIITEDELEVIIQPNDVLTKNMESLVYGGGPGGLPGGGPIGMPGEGCPQKDCNCKYKGCKHNSPK